jgi:hypothetical protein
VVSKLLRMDDTTPQAADRQREAIRRMAAAERLRVMFAMSESMRAASLNALRRQFPGETTLQLLSRLSGESMVPCTRSGPIIFPRSTPS